ncbi:MAG: hypothetical protein QW728_01050 [Thermoplasmata archaeon]
MIRLKVVMITCILFMAAVMLTGIPPCSVSDAQDTSSGNQLVCHMMTCNVTINYDCSITINYIFDWEYKTAVSRYPELEFDVGMPSVNYTVTSVGGAAKSNYDHQSTYIACGPLIRTTIMAGQRGLVYVNATVTSMIYARSDTSVALLFTPCWFTDYPISAMYLNVFLPTGISEGDTFINNTYNIGQKTTENGRTVVKWQKMPLGRNEYYLVEVEFPKTGIDGSRIVTTPPTNPNMKNTSTTGTCFSTFLLIIICIICAPVIIIMMIISAITRKLGFRRGYSSPSYGHSTSGPSFSSGRRSCACACACAGGGAR